ncbi:XrtA/PEP-CTERM system-associated ATPase [Desulfuromonas sp. TF]|uniref:XrtA/PEP-CTERM system-associated ATPase n=1 Tax=Desulfuromonas sp. TF TaxID=1232410 RepID=UPI0003F6DA8C|nr:XrtA/PEP-CTERM system-associated ATPase [Desulfuromonas sp. TF]
MYESFFGLHSKPFDLVPDPRFLYLGRAHQKALNYLRYGIEEGAGFVLLTGEVGSGKTTIIRNLIGELDTGVCLAMVFNTRVSGEQLLSLINDDFGLETVGKDKVTLLRDLNDFLIARHAEGCRSILIIDEAQNLSPETLEEVRLLSNLEAAHSKLLQIILVGQPELQKVLARSDLRQLRQRISINCNLDPLNRQETENYILHRLELAGNREAVRFAEGAFDVIFKHSRGTPRLINIFCDFLLLAAFAESTTVLHPELVEEVAGEFSTREASIREKDPTASGPPMGAEENGSWKDILSLIEDLQDRQQKLMGRFVLQEKMIKSLIDGQREVAKQKAENLRMEETLSGISRQLSDLRTGLRFSSGIRSELPEKEPEKKGFLERLFGV